MFRFDAPPQKLLSTFQGKAQLPTLIPSGVAQSRQHGALQPRRNKPEREDSLTGQTGANGCQRLNVVSARFPQEGKRTRNQHPSRG